MTNSPLTSPPPTAKLRPLKATDILLLQEAYPPLSHDQDVEESTKRYIRYMFHRLFVIGTSIGWVIEVDNELAGCAILSSEKHPYETPEEYLVAELIYIRKRFRSMGLPMQLIHAGWKWAKEANFHRIKLRLLSKNNHYNKDLKTLGVKELGTDCEWRDYENS